MLEKARSHWQNLPRKLQIVLLLVLILLVSNIMSRVYSAIKLQQQAIDDEWPIVSVITAKATTEKEHILLPGNVAAWHGTTLYARTNGYVKQWYVDIGSVVKKDDLLAVIETPELDAQLLQAKADLKKAIADNQLAQSTAKRWVHLVKTASVSQQDRDEKVSMAAAQSALVAASQANVLRLQELVGFQRVIAPFDGVITARHTDIGALINQGSENNIPLFAIAQNNPLRVYVRIPQNYTSRISPKMKIQLRFTEYPGTAFVAELIDTAKAIDFKTRTLLAEFKVNNPKGILLPGEYTEVTLIIPPPAHAIKIPVNTLLFQSAGMQVAVVDKNHHVMRRAVTINRDFGSEVEIVSGISAGEHIILYPPDDIHDGETVRVAS